MKYTFNVTTSESRIISTQLNLPEEMQVKDLKLKLIGPIIESIGYDKVKFFQKGSIFGDDQCMGDFNASENILIFPMNPSLRTILITTLQGNDSVVDSAVFSVPVPSVTATMDSSGPEGGSASTSIISVREINPEIMGGSDEVKEIEQDFVIPEPEPEPEIVMKTGDDVKEISKNTLELFNKETTQMLLKLFYLHRDDFMEFVTYMSSGSFIPSDESSETIEYEEEFLLKVKSIFPFYEDAKLEDISSDLSKFGGNLNILISHKMSELLE
jgi:hypothetical protein